MQFFYDLTKGGSAFVEQLYPNIRYEADIPARSSDIC